MLACAHIRLGHYHQAQELSRQALTLASADSHGFAEALLNLSICANETNDLDASEACNLQAVDLGSRVCAPRNPFLAAGTALAVVNTPCILIQSEKLMDPDLRDRMVEELLVAVMGYLKKRCQLWCAFDKFSDPKSSGRIGECRFRPS